MDDKPNPLNLAWGIALVMAGIGVFFRLPQVMPKILEIAQFAGASGFIRFSFYFMAVILIGGGIRKIRHHLSGTKPDTAPDV